MKKIFSLFYILVNKIAHSKTLKKADNPTHGHRNCRLLFNSIYSHTDPHSIGKIAIHSSIIKTSNLRKEKEKAHSGMPTFNLAWFRWPYWGDDENYI